MFERPQFWLKMNWLAQGNLALGLVAERWERLTRLLLEVDSEEVASRLVYWFEVRRWARRLAAHAEMQLGDLQLQ